MNFFNSLPLDLKMLTVGIAGSALLALFSGNHKSEKRYMVVLALLAAAGVYRFAQVERDDHSARDSAETPVSHSANAPTKKAPLVSTFAK